MRTGVAVVLVVAAHAAAAAPSVSVERAATLLAPDASPRCADIPCLIAHAYAADPKARALALALFDESGDVAGIGVDEHMDGGYRGMIHLVPQLPIGHYRQHLAWVAGASRGFEAFFGELFVDQPAPAYRWTGLAFRFVRSIRKHTPSAYATHWEIAYNVEGSLLTSAAGVLETLFHELFHLNDEDHGDWSARALQADYDAIVATCAGKVRCLAPFAPNTTKVRATGSYYAFQPNNGNGVHEYAAELAVRYFREQTQMLHAKRLTGPAFKCGPPQNARAWSAFVAEFFGGRDLVPACR